MHRPQRSPFSWFASFALAPLALASLHGCTLTEGDFEPGVASFPPVDEATDPHDPLPPENAPSAEPDEGDDVGDDGVDGNVEASPPTESLGGPDVPLAPSEPSNGGDDGNSAGDGTSPPCTSDCGSEPAGDEPTGDEPTGEGGDDGSISPCADGTCQEPPGAPCDAPEICESSVCTSGRCRAPSCSDGVRNADEAGSDCGGPCVPCPCTYGTPEVLGDPNFAGNLLFAPSLSTDGLTLFFGVYIAGATETIAFSTRPSPAGPFGLGVLLPATIDASIEGTPRLAPDGLTLYFYSERAGGLGFRDIYRAQRQTLNAAFDAVTNLTEINSTGVDHLPWVSPDGRTLYFSSDRAGNLDIYRTTRAQVADAWRAPEPVTELNTAAVDNGMTVSADQQEIVFASYRLGGSDLFRAVRAPGEATFRAPELLPSINTDAEDADPALSLDGTELYFSSTRDGIDSRIWRVSRTCP